MLKLKQCGAALIAACALTAFSLPASAEHVGGHVSGGFHGGGFHRDAGFHGGHRGHWRGGGFGWGPSIYLGDDYDSDYTCYWRHGRRYCD